MLLLLLVVGVGLGLLMGFRKGFRKWVLSGRGSPALCLLGFEVLWDCWRRRDKGLGNFGMGLVTQIMLEIEIVGIPCEEF